MNWLNWLRTRTSKEREVRGQEMVSKETRDGREPEKKGRSPSVRFDLEEDERGRPRLVTRRRRR